MELTIASVDYAPPELHRQLPIFVELLNEIPGDDRPDYWLGVSKIPIKWMDGETERIITHVVVAARWEGTRIEPDVEFLPVGIAYVTDVSLLQDEQLDFRKTKYIAIGVATTIAGGKEPKLPRQFPSGTVAKGFGLGKSD